LIASSRAPTLPDVIIKKLTKPLVKAAELAEEADLMVIDGPEEHPSYDWMSPIRTYLDSKTLSDDNAEIEHVARKSRMYHLVDGLLYMQGTNGIMMRCISKKRRYSITSGYSQRSIWGTLIMALYRCKSI
jgi:hypothetical protein